MNVEFEKPISAEEARDILREAPGCLVIDKHEPGGYITPNEAAGEDATYISRIREDATVENGLMLWIVSDNLRKGAALNTVQIAELLVNRKLIQPRRKAASKRLSSPGRDDRVPGSDREHARGFDAPAPSSRRGHGLALVVEEMFGGGGIVALASPGQEIEAVAAVCEGGADDGKGLARHIVARGRRGFGNELEGIGLIEGVP